MKIVIVGAGEVGSHLAKMLRREGGDVTVIDSDAERLHKLSQTADVATVQGNPSSIATLKESGVAGADLFISVYPSFAQEVNIVSALLAKSLGAAKVTARINDEDYLNADNKLLFKEMGIELLFYPEKIAADEIVSCIKSSTPSDSMDFAHGRLHITVFKIDDESPVLDMKVGEFASQAASDGLQFRVIAISREDSTIIPGADTTFQWGDMVYTIVLREGMESLMKYFGKSAVQIQKVMIFGGTPMAEMVARALSHQLESIKIIESDKERCRELVERLDSRVEVACGDGRNSDFLLEENIRDYDAFVALTSGDETNVLSCVVAKKLGISRTIAEVENIEYMRLAEDMGVDTVINKKLITAGRMFKFTLSGRARFVRYMTGTQAEVLEYTAAPGSLITKAPLKDLNFPENALVGGVIRGSESFIAVGTSQIEPYDRVAVFALGESVGDVDKFFK
ncbi:MAG: Trk system potassium transporter TrkA [Bacteroidales bacterium]|nr:Trk system potassium transporter TrkA [Bacteroidales bacterium]